MGGAPKTIISMKKALIAVAMIAATMTANAQQEVGQITLQPKFGISLATLSENENSNNFAQKYGITVGVEAMYQASKQEPWSFCRPAVCHARSECCKSKQQFLLWREQ